MQEENIIMLNLKKFSFVAMFAILSIASAAYATDEKDGCESTGIVSNCDGEIPTLPEGPDAPRCVIEVTENDYKPARSVCCLCGYNTYTDGDLEWKVPIYQLSNITDHTLISQMNCDAKGNNPATIGNPVTCTVSAKVMVGSQNEGSCPQTA